MVKTSSSDAQLAGSTLVWEVRSYVLCSPRNENVDQKQYSSTFHKDFKNNPHQKEKKKDLKKYMRVCLSVGGGSDEISVCLGRTWGGSWVPSV